MEQINKLLILLVVLSIGINAYIVKTTVSMNKNVAPHPYNECIKLLIDQVNKENRESDFDKMKAVCFVLSDKDKN
ncbi:hypothetical protein OAP56_03210 [Rickettsiaceae bacterium]|jgi:hypothetical protein|nr:hypothetical protein [Rickettsiaceae bacterium]